MLINAILPYVFLLKGFLVKMIMRAWDNKFSGSPYKTRKTSMAQYKNLYSGPQYRVHIKNAGLLAIVYTTCMYGMAMPLLFPLAAFRFFNLWVCERIRVAYHVKLPPALDDELTNSCIRMLKYAPLFLVCNAYWMLSNPQIFENRWFYKDQKVHSMLSGHHVQDAAEICPASPLLLMSIGSLTLLGIKRIFYDRLQEWGFSMMPKNIIVDEHLPNFYKAVKLSQADELIEEQINMNDDQLLNSKI